MKLSDRIRRSWAALRGKSLLDLHPELRDRVHVYSSRAGEIRQAGPYSYLKAVEDYENGVWVRKAIKVLSDNLAAVPVKVQRGDQFDEAHALTKLLASVNDTLTAGDLWQQWVVDMMLAGEEGWELSKNGGSVPVEIWPRQPHTVHVMPDPAKRRYFRVTEYRIDDGLPDPSSPGKTGFTLQPDEFIHFKFYNPRNPWRGLSPLSAASLSVLLDRFAQVSTKTGASPRWAIVAPPGITQAEKEQILDQFRSKQVGYQVEDEPIILEQGITDAKILSFPPKDMEWEKLRSMNREEIGATFGVPDGLMGWGQESYDTATKVEGDLYALWMLTIMPLAAFRDQQLTEWFRRNSLLGEKESIASDYSKVKVVQEGLSDLLDQAVKLSQIGVPFNVIDERLKLGVGPIPGGDQPYSRFAPAVTTPMPEAAPPQAAPTRSIKAVFPDFGSEDHLKLWGELAKRTGPGEQQLYETLVELLKNQAAAVLTLLRHEGPERAASDPFQRELWEQRFAEASEPVLRQIILQAAEAALHDLGAPSAFDFSNPGAVAFLQGRVQRFAVEVNETTWQALKDSLSEGLRAGEGIPQLSARVEQLMGDRIRSSAETIARTEVNGAANGATQLAWEQSGLNLEKSWITALDERVRPTHVAAHGQTVPLRANFQVGTGQGPAPGQIGLPEEDINCRCRAIARVITVQHGANGHHHERLPAERHA